jgi:23S rRNA pseudouridine1911/1915/1917 synthase
MSERHAASKPIVERVTVPPELAGQRLDQVIPALVPALSRRRARDILTRGGVWTGDQRIRTQSLEVAAGMPLIIVYPPDFKYRELTIQASDVLWEDRWLIALRKGAGWYVQPTSWDIFGNMERALADFLVQREGLKSTKLHLTHRLDRDTSGVMIVAKEPEINGPMQRLWSSGGVTKIYTALVVGHPPAEWECNEPLGPGGHAQYKVDHSSQGRSAQTFFRTLSLSSNQQDAVAEIEARPQTGRTHQIRIHAAHTGHTLLGDERYEGPYEIGGHIAARVMLHAAALYFRHPMTGEAIRLEAAPPKDYADLKAALGL